MALVSVFKHKQCWIFYVCIFHASTEHNTNTIYCTLCSLLQSCISFVMKSVERANFKLISPTQRTPITRDAKRAETNTKISVDNTALHLQLIMWMRLFCCCCCYRFGVNRSVLLYSVVLSKVQLSSVSGCCCALVYSLLFYSALFYFCLHAVNIWTVLCGCRLAQLCSTTASPNCCGLSAHQPVSV